MGSYIIWRGGGWRRVDASSGTLETGERVQFVYSSGGSLHVAPRRKILPRLQAHEAGHPQRELRRAAELPSRRVTRRRRWRKALPMGPLHQPCYHATAATTAPLPLSPPSCQLQQPAKQTEQQNKQLQAEQQNKQLQTEQQNKQLQAEQQNKQLQTEQQNKQLHSGEQNKELQSAQSAQENKQQQSSSDTSSQESPYKELLVDYSDVKCIQLYLEKNPQVFGPIDSDLFTENAMYRSGVLFRFQPIVKIKRLKSIKKYFKKDFASHLGLKHKEDAKKEKKTYKTRTSNNNKNFLKYFDRGSNKENNVGNATGESETDIETETPSLKPRNGKPVSQREIDNLLNEPKHLRSNTSTIQISPTRVRERAEARPSRKRKRDDNSDSVSVGKPERGSSKVRERDGTKKSRRFFSNKERPNGVKSRRVAKPVSFKSGTGREYSSLEDHAIVAWIHNAGRSRLVNGNRVWKELQHAYPNITAHSRSWQSLRNRYLRHILPTLAALRIEPTVQEALRANAAIGEIKLSRKKSLNRRNSIFKDNKVASAWSRQPRTQGLLAASTPSADSPTRITRNSTRKQDNEIDQTTRRTKPNSDEHSSETGEHSSETDEFQPKPTRLNTNERRNNDIKTLAQRYMRSSRGGNTSVNSATKNLDKNVSNKDKNVSNQDKNVSNQDKNVSNQDKNERQMTKKVTNLRNKLSNVTPKVPTLTKNVPNDSDNDNSVIKTRNSTSKLSEVINSRSLVNGERSPRTLAHISSPTGSTKQNLRSPRTLAGNLYGSPNNSRSGSGKKPRLSADKHIARARAAVPKRALYNHRAVPL